MTGFKVERFAFTEASIREWGRRDPLHSNWPVVYVLDGAERSAGLPKVYVGESTNAERRFLQHRADRTEHKAGLDGVRVILGREYNKSVCHDLESHLIQLLSGDGGVEVLNRNDGIVDADYFNRANYRRGFDEVFDELRREGLFSRSIPEIVNSDLYKLSPFKALNRDQAVAVEDVLEGLFADLATGATSTTVVEGAPGTGKTIVAIFLIKLLKDIAVARHDSDADNDSMFSDFFMDGYRELVQDARIGLVVPQQSLRSSIRSVFKRTPGLSAAMVMSPFEVGKSDGEFDLLIVDETHRLNQRANQPSGPLNKMFGDITTNLFGYDDLERTQLDWIVAKSRHQLFLLDGAQSVRPADLPSETVTSLATEARASGRWYPLASQMRVGAEGDYVGFVRDLLSASPSASASFSEYEFELFDDLAAMKRRIELKDAEVGLARLVAGFAWPWASKKDASAFDIEIGTARLRWNRTDRDWINSPGSLQEVGSIHTVQGYDLNYAGVIIGPDLRFDPETQTLFVDRDSYHDKKGKENVPRLGASYAADNLFRFITNAYSVLLTRGMRGTFVYVCDPHLREYVRTTLAKASS